MNAAAIDSDRAQLLRVVIAEDDVLMRAGIARLLTDARCEVVAQAGDADALRRKTLAHQPDVVITDVRMPPGHRDDGLMAAIELRQRLPDMGVVVLSQYCEEALALKLIADHADGVGYLLKERVGEVEEFIDAVRRVAAGGSALDPEVVARMLGRRGASGALAELTARERDVLAAMAEGKSNHGIARTLFISEAVVEKHVTAIMQKLDIGPTVTGNRRVLAVLAHLRAHQR
jgi:DNA-binding NarL/FixJ family response regulator